MAQWQWRFVELSDIADVVALAQQHFQSEITDIFTPDPYRYQHHVTTAVVNQSFDPLSVQLIAAYDSQGLAAYTWCTRGHFMTYAREEVAEVLFAHVRMSLSVRSRIRLVREMIEQWELWCRCSGIGVLVSSTIRQDQTGFLRLHEQAGFTIRGSMAFKRIAR